MRRCILAALAALVMLAAAPASAQPGADDGQGVKVRRASLIRKLVSAEMLEKAALVQYDQLRSQAVARNALLPADDAQAKRVQRIANDLLPFTHKWHDNAKAWKWDVIIVKSPAINALCMPGGKIAVFTGLLDSLKLTDDEVAVVLGHEMAHALREHARTRAAKVTLTNVGTLAVALVIGGNVGEIARPGGGLLALKFNRDDERDADLIGLELAARAGSTDVQVPVPRHIWRMRAPRSTVAAGLRAPGVEIPEGGGQKRASKLPAMPAGMKRVRTA
jgi:Zn-dependent protease with chaperone function